MNTDCTHNSYLVLNVVNGNREIVSVTGDDAFFGQALVPRIFRAYPLVWGGNSHACNIRLL